jgi:hypothetical protein
VTVRCPNPPSFLGDDCGKDTWFIFGYNMLVSGASVSVIYAVILFLAEVVSVSGMAAWEHRYKTSRPIRQTFCVSV